MRADLADSQGVPPYVIFHDTTLAALATHKPEKVTELIDISGIGASKQDRYGQAVVDVIQQHLTNP